MRLGDRIARLQRDVGFGLWSAYVAGLRRRILAKPVVLSAEERDILWLDIGYRLRLDPTSVTREQTLWLLGEIVRDNHTPELEYALDRVAALDDEGLETFVAGILVNTEDDGWTRPVVAAEYRAWLAAHIARMRG